MVVEDGDESYADGIDPEGDPQGLDEPWTRVGDTVGSGISDHCCEAEPECCKEKPFVGVGERVFECSGVYNEARDHKCRNDEEENNVDNENECANTGKGVESIRDDGKHKRYSTCRHCASIPGKSKVF